MRGLFKKKDSNRDQRMWFKKKREDFSETFKISENFVLLNNSSAAARRRVEVKEIIKEKGMRLTTGSVMTKRQ